MAFYEMDKRAQERARHDILSIENRVGQITAEPELRVALEFALTEYKSAQEAHAVAIADRADDRSEVTTASAAFDEASAEVFDIYAGLKSVAGTFVSRYAISQLSEIEKAERRGLYDRLFRHPASRLAEEARGARLVFLKDFIETLEGSELVKKQLREMIEVTFNGGVAKMRAAVDHFTQTFQAYTNLKDSNQQKTEQVEALREKLATSSSVYSLILTAILTREGRQGEISQYLLHQDPAYLARFRPRDKSAEIVAIDETSPENSSET